MGLQVHTSMPLLTFSGLSFLCNNCRGWQCKSVRSLWFYIVLLILSIHWFTVFDSLLSICLLVAVQYLVDAVFWFLTTLCQPKIHKHNSRIIFHALLKLLSTILKIIMHSKEAWKMWINSRESHNTRPQRIIIQCFHFSAFLRKSAIFVLPGNLHTWFFNSMKKILKWIFFPWKKNCYV